MSTDSGIPDPGEGQRLAQDRHSQFLEKLHQLKLEGAKGLVTRGKDRVTVLPDGLITPLKEHLVRVKALHVSDLHQGRGDVELPFALARKYQRAAYQWTWQYIFPARGLSTDPRSGAFRRHHIDEKRLQRHFQRALARAHIQKRATPHSLRHAFATQLLEAGYDCWRALKIDHRFSLKNDQGRKPRDRPSAVDKCIGFGVRSVLEFSPPRRGLSASFWLVRAN